MIRRSSCVVSVRGLGGGLGENLDRLMVPGGATLDDLKLMREHSPDRVQIKAAGGIRTLDQLLEVRDLGVSRVGASATSRYSGYLPDPVETSRDFNLTCRCNTDVSCMPIVIFSCLQLPVPGRVSLRMSSSFPVEADGSSLPQPN